VRPAGSRSYRDGHEHLLDRKHRQFVNVTIFNPLIKKLDYDRVSREAMRWWPMGKDTPIVVDPKHAFGAPSVASAAVTTATLFASFRTNKSAEMVADWFGVTLDEVRAAVRFEQSHVRQARPSRRGAWSRRYVAKATTFGGGGFAGGYTRYIAPPMAR